MSARWVVACCSADRWAGAVYPPRLPPPSPHITRAPAPQLASVEAGAQAQKGSHMSDPLLYHCLIFGFGSVVGAYLVAAVVGIVREARS